MSIINNRGIFNAGTAYLRQVGNDWPTAQVFYTSDIIEVAANLYFSNARVYSNVIALLPTLAGSGIAIQANGQISANAATVTFASISQFLTTSNVAEGSNLYYTNARVISAVLPYLTTSNVAEGSNLYYTNARVYSNVIALLPTLAGSGIQIQANGQINANASATSGFATSSNVANTVLSLNNFTTANLVEGTNLYYTNARVASNVIGLLPSLAGSGILIQANGQINANVSTVVILTNDVIPVTQGNTAYTLSRVVTDPKAILVINEGLIQIPTTDYTVSGTTLTTTTQYPVGSNIEVRYFGTISSTQSPSLSSTVNTFAGDGSNVNYTLSSSPASTAYTMVNVDGVLQLITAYSVSGTILTFTEAPALGANIEIRVLDGTVTGSTTLASSRVYALSTIFGG